MLTVFLRLEISAVFADSPMYRDFGPKPTRDLICCKSVLSIWRGGAIGR